MKEVDNLDSIKEEWVCETGPPDSQPLNDNQQKDCDCIVDSLLRKQRRLVPKVCPLQNRRNRYLNHNSANYKNPTDFLKTDIKRVDVNIKLWKNGFTVNDDFRSYSDGASQQFLNSIKKGELPSELRGVFDKEEVDVKVEDKKMNATPKIVSKARNIEVDNKSTLSAVSLNNLEPITRIQIWLANGERTVQRFNVSHRVSHIKDFIEKYQGSQRSPPFALATALPFLRFLDETLTLEEADLQNAVVIQRLQKSAEPFRKL